MEVPSLFRSQKLQEHVSEWGGALAPGTSLSLEVTLLAACLRDQRPESESLSWLWLLSIGIEALLVTMRFSRTQIGNCRIWSNWKCNVLLPLVALALSGLEEALWWPLSQLPRHSFGGISGNELEGLDLVAWGHKSLFPHWSSLLLSRILAWWQKEQLGCCLSLYDSPLLLWSGLYSGMSMGTHKMDANPVNTSLGNILKICAPLQATSGEKDKSNKGLGDMELNQSGMLSGLPLVHLHPTLVVELEEMSKMPALVRDRLSLTREGKLQWRVCLHPHLEQWRTLLVEKKKHGCGSCFFLSYRWEIAVPEPLL